MTRVCTYTNLIPFDGKLLTAKLRNRKANKNDLINHPSIMFSSNQLIYFEKMGLIPEEYFAQINAVLSDPNFTGKHVSKGQKYSGNLVDFSSSEYTDLRQRCKKINISFSELLNIEHISSETVRRYKKDRNIPSDLLDKINKRLSIMERDFESKAKVVEETPVIVENKTEPKVEPKKIESDFAKVVQSLKKVVRYNGEANLNLDNISERYDCDIETFVNSVFSLVSSENYVIYTTYSNGKPVFTLGEQM